MRARATLVVSMENPASDGPEKAPPRCASCEVGGAIRKARKSRLGVGTAGRAAILHYSAGSGCDIPERAP